jgi:hypothetical protein
MIPPLLPTLAGVSGLVGLFVGLFCQTISGTGREEKPLHG